MRRELEISFGNVGLDSTPQMTSLFIVLADDQHRVISRNGADNLIPILRINASCDWLRAAHGGQNNQEVLGLTYFQSKVLQDACDRWKIVLAIRG